MTDLFKLMKDVDFKQLVNELSRLVFYQEREAVNKSLKHMKHLKSPSQTLIAIQFWLFMRKFDKIQFVMHEECQKYDINIQMELKYYPA